ncbi:MAG: alpha/beta hydrolase [Sedimentisphaerales bacterium]|nr:alpha/beta hydrolase [Sedimentisphaerales bacterium]
MWTILLYLGIVLCAAYVSWALVLFVMQPRFVYRPVRDVSYTPGDLDLDFEEVVFKSGDGVSLNGWWIPAKDAVFTVLFCHGNGGNIMHRLDSINILHGFGLNCFIFDYRGYGRSEGNPSEAGTYADARAAYDWAVNCKNVRPDEMILFGKSMGGSIAAQLATKVQAGGLVLENSFTSYAAMGARFYPYMPVRWFARFGYKTISYVKAVRCPVLVIHSKYDEIVPFEFGAALYEAANEPKEFVEILGGHNDGFLVSAKTYENAWSRWLQFLADAKDKAGHQAS